MRRRSVIYLLLTVFLLTFSLVEAQQPTKVPRIGCLAGNSSFAESPRVEAFRQGLRDLGYVEGQNVTIEWRSAEGKLDWLPGLAAELVRLKVDIIVAAGGDPDLRRVRGDETPRAVRKCAFV